MTDDDDCRSVDSQEEGLQLLLGGLSSASMFESEWTEEMKEPDEEAIGIEKGKTMSSGSLTTPSTATHTLLSQRQVPFPSAAIDRSGMPIVHVNFRHGAYRISSDGRVVQPPLSIVDMSLIGKGNGVVAKERLRRGTVILTEKLVAGTQVPQSVQGTNVVPVPWQDLLFPVRGCLACLRSLEPISSCSSSSNSVEGTTCPHAFPMPQLWPIDEYDNNIREDDTNQTDHDVYEKDGHKQKLPSLGQSYRQDCRTGRLQCRSCGALFCNSFCAESFQTMYASGCCGVRNALSVLPDHQAELGNDVSAVALGILLFAQMYKTNGDGWNENAATVLHGLCGSPNDLEALQLGDAKALLPAILQALDWNHKEKLSTTATNTAWTSSREQNVSVATSTEQLFARCVAAAARNGISLTTKSPFREYYASLLRASGGQRESERHCQHKRQIALALGATDGTLQRGMDRIVEEKCAVMVAAICPFLARINHSCDPNAELKSQEYVDGHVDVVARRDISVGEEVTIAYIDSTSRRMSSRVRRQRELRSRYLFECVCERCSDDTTTGE